jgi:hypothetical protein
MSRIPKFIATASRFRPKFFSKVSSRAKLSQQEKTLCGGNQVMSEIACIQRLERRIRLVTGGWLLSVLVVVACGWTFRQQQPDTLRVRQIVVVDDKGTERVGIGAPVLDPIQGQRQKRQGPVSGIVVLDAKGNERGGYVTSDLSGEVFMSLDSEKGQETLFLANPDGGAHVSIFDGQGNLARLGVLDKQPTLLRRAGNVIFEQPPTK